MLTQRQKEVLQLIVELYGRLEEPIGSKTLLKESCLTVSPATIRNDMVALEQEGLLNKAHSSSGRIPSHAGYRYYVERLVLAKDIFELAVEDYNRFHHLLADYYYDPVQVSQLALEMLVNMTGYTGFILRQDNEKHYFHEMKLILLENNKVIAMLLVDSGRVESHLIDLPISLSKIEIDQVSQLINDELKGTLLEDAYQRLKSSIPLQIQRLIGYQIDFSSILEESLTQLKTHQYKVIGKLNIFDLVGHQLDVNALKELFKLVDGSKKMYDLLESGRPGTNVLFGFEFAPESLANISIIYTKYGVGSQEFCLGLVGPSAMDYDRIVSIMNQVRNKLID